MAQSSLSSNVSGLSAPFTGATTNSAGTIGSVPTPPALGSGLPKALLSDATWGEVASSDVVQTLTATGTVTAWSSLVLVNATAGNVIVTLPAASGGVGKTVKVVKTDSSSNTITIAANGADTMNSIVSLVLSQQNQTLTIEAATTSTVRTVANMANAVLAEYGAVQVDNQIFSGSDTFVNSTNGIYAIPSAGIWLLTYELSTDGTGANTTSQVAIHSPTATVVSGSERVRGGGVTTTAPLSCTVLISTTGAANYRLVGRRGGSGSMTIINSALTTSGITWQKIGGFAPIEGQLVDYIHIVATTNQTTGITVGSPVLFNTAVTKGNIPHAAGVFTLESGKTYSLRGGIGNISAGTELICQWRDITNNVLIGNSGNAHVSAAGRNTLATANITTTSPITVRLEILFTNGVTDIGSSNARQSFAEITQIGSSAYNTLNTFTGATSVLAGSAGGVLAPVAGEQDEFLRGNGTWSKKVFSGARRYASAATAIPGTNTDTVVTTGTVDYNVGTDVTTLIANQIAIVTNGYYRCTGAYEMTSGATTDRYAATIRINGLTEAIGGFCTSVSSTINPQVTATLFLVAPNIVSLGAIAGDAQSTVAGSSKTYIEVEFLGV